MSTEWRHRVSRSPPQGHSLYALKEDEYHIAIGQIANPWNWRIIDRVSASRSEVSADSGSEAPNQTPAGTTWDATGFCVFNFDILDTSSHAFIRKNGQPIPLVMIYLPTPTPTSTSTSLIESERHVTDGFFRKIFNLDHSVFGDEVASSWVEDEVVATLDVDGERFVDRQNAIEDPWAAGCGAIFNVMRTAYRSRLRSELFTSFDELIGGLGLIESSVYRKNNQSHEEDPRELVVFIERLIGLSMEMKTWVASHPDETSMPPDFQRLATKFSQQLESARLEFMKGFAGKLGQRTADLMIYILTLIAVLYWLA